ncbi:AAA family ATPase [Maribacter sp. 2308TA10-17]|uniref:AAA family ATPase n=1 Tax=Maribacter sp. 2308TA10-17 TaxID=3386276 RepID=UPI0039BD4723
MRQLVGRIQERGILEAALKSNRPELIVVYGRRRIGKTFLIDKVYEKEIKFRFSGIHNASLKEQLANFHLVLSDKNLRFKEPKSWIEAFHHLGKYFDTLKSKKKKVLFIDEFPWLDSRRSNFLSAFDNFWNNYASKRDDMVVIVCGSAASYMIQNIIKNKGGLHNRLTESIQLAAFNLNETEQLLKQNKVKFSRYDILQIYMAMGGIPHYLDKINPGESVPQALDRLCFMKNGFLRTEFENVFASLFDFYENHESIVRSLASVRKGLTRNEISAKTGMPSGGGLTKALMELEDSGFIENYLPYQGVKDSIYRLSDEYSMFYIKYIEKTKPSQGGLWMVMQGKQSYKIWSGYSFETICIKHVEQIKEGLKIAGINSTHGSWIEKGNGKGAQIDMLIDRDDNVINLCEMKFYNTEFTLNKKYANEIANKSNKFVESTKTKKSVFVTFITTYGLVSNQYSKQYVQNELTIDNLFKKL